MFENFPYTNFHDLNLDWIIQKIMDAYSPDNPPPVGMVASVNGKTGIVVLTGEDIKAAAGDPDSIKTILDNLAAGKQDAPAAAGSSGQFLGLDVNGDPVWATPSGSGTTDYNDLTNKPQVAGVTLSGNKTLSDLGAQPAPAAAGTAGQFLGLDSNLDPVWDTPSGSGTTNYNDLTNKPQVEGVTLSGNKTLSDLGAQPAPAAAGTAGQVLSLDNSLNPVWSTPSGGSSNYNDLSNKPQIENVTLSGNKTLNDLGAMKKPTSPGTAGQVLTLDINLDPVWQTQTIGHNLYRITTDGVKTWNELLADFYDILESVNSTNRFWAKINIGQIYTFSSYRSGVYEFTSPTWNADSSKIQLSEIILISNSIASFKYYYADGTQETPGTQVPTAGINIDLMI